MSVTRFTLRAWSPGAPRLRAGPQYGTAITRRGFKAISDERG